MRLTSGILVALVVAFAGPAFADFTEQTQFGTTATIPIAWGDFDANGELDLAVGDFTGQNELYIDNGDGTFTPQNQFGADATFALSWADYDNDGDLDLAVGNGSDQQNKLYVNNGDGTFTEVAEFGLRRSNAVAWADYDNDGDLDVAVGNGLLGLDERNRLFENLGNGTFSGSAPFGRGGQSASVVWGDFDNDGDADLAVGNGGFGTAEPNSLWVNNADGTFTPREEFGGGDTASLDWGDYDNDGDLDLAVANWDGGQNRLYENNGDGTFTGRDEFGARDPNTVSWGDYDNDGDLDLAVGNGDFTTADSNYLYINNNDGTFTEVAAFGLGSTDAVAWGDFDDDGDLDLAVGNEHTPTQNYLYLNNENDNDYLILDLVGHFYDLGSGYSNRDGVGAQVSVYTAGFLGDPSQLLGYREVAAHGGFSAQDMIDPHFGLPGQDSVDVRIVWPGSGGTRIVQLLEGVAVGQRLLVNESGTSTGVPGGRGFKSGALQARPNPMRYSTAFELTLPPGVTPRIDIFDPAGRLVRTLAARGVASGGSYRLDWDGRAQNGARVAPGVYFARAPRQSSSAAAARVVLIR